MHRRHRIVLMAAAFVLGLGGAALAQGMGLGFGMDGRLSKGGGTGSSPGNSILVNTGVAMLVNTGSKLSVQ